MINLGSAFGKIILDVDDVLTGEAKASLAAERIGKSFGNMGKELSSVGKDLTTHVTLPLVGIGVAAVKTAADFDSQMAELTVAARSSGTSLEELRGIAIKTGADTRLVGISASQSAEAMTNFYKAGLTTNDIFDDMNGYMEDNVELGGALRASVDLQAASELSLADASDAVAIAMATYGLKAKDANRIANSFVQTADASVASVSELAQALIAIGPSANAFGWSLEDTNAALGILSERGIRGAEAGNQLKSMLANMMRDTAEAKDMWNNLGISLYHADGTMRSMPDIIGSLNNAMAGMTNQQRDQVTQTLAGTRGMAALRTLVEEGAVGWQNMEKAVGSAATVQEIAAAKAATFNGSLEALQGSLETLLIEVGTPLINDFLRPLVDWLARLTSDLVDLDPQVIKWGLGLAGVAAAAGPLLMVTGSLASSMGTLIGVGKSLFLAMQALPGVLSAANVGFQLMAQGESLASVASLGLSAALGPIVLVVVAVTSAVVAGTMAMKKYKEIQERTADVADAWTQFLQEQVTLGKTASEIADEYASTQARVNEQMEKNWLGTKLLTGGLIPLVDKQKLLNADAETLSNTLYDTAGSYDEYRAAAEKAGLTTGNASKVLSEEEFAARKTAAALDTAKKSTVNLGNVTTHWEDIVKEASKGAVTFGNTVVASVKEVVVAYSQLDVSGSDFFRNLADMQDRHRQEQVEASLSYSEHRAGIEAEYQNKVLEIEQAGRDAAAAAGLQGDAIRLADLQYKLDLELQKQAEFTEKTKESVRMASEHKVALLRAQIDAEQALLDGRTGAAATAYATATNLEIAEAQRNKDEQLRILNEQYGEEQRKMAESQAAERDEMKRHLGELLLQRINYWVESGKLTAEEGARLTNTVMEQYGIIDKESLATWQNATKAIDDYALGVTTSLPLVETQLGLTAEGITNMTTDSNAALAEAQQQFANYGMTVPEDLLKTGQAADETKLAFERNLAAVQELLNGTGVESSQFSTEFDKNMALVRLMMAGTGDDSKTLQTVSETTFPKSGLAIEQYANGAAGDLIGLQALLGDTKRAIDDLPTSKTVRILVEYDAPDEFHTNSPTFVFQHALESAVDFARANPIPVSVEPLNMPAAHIIGQNANIAPQSTYRQATEARVADQRTMLTNYGGISLNGIQDAPGLLEQLQEMM